MSKDSFQHAQILQTEWNRKCEGDRTEEFVSWPEEALTKDYSEGICNNMLYGTINNLNMLSSLLF